MSARRRVLWISTSTATRGGIASYVRSLRTTPLWTRWSVVHVATHEDGSTARKVVRFLLGALQVLLRLALRPPPLVHVHTSTRGSFVRKSLLARAAVLRGVPVVLHVHGGAFDSYHDRAPRPLRRWIRTTLEAVDVVVALGPSWATVLQRIAPGAQVVVVPNAVEPGPAPAPADRGGAPTTVLFLGQVSALKNVPLLVDAWAKVRTDLHTPARLVVAGDGDDLDRVGAAVARHGLGADVELRGWVPPAEVDGLLAAADVLVLPSRWEGQPMAVLEAMARGLAVVATEVGGVVDLVDADSGLLVPPDDVDALAGALRTVLDDAALRARLGAGGRRRVEAEFSVDRTWRTLDDLYRGLVR
ncbi:glycosyltransferase family 4 protein [Nocardioides sp. CFH 31398]|uniref:glycosyltransferase family 4 protein n=1 Tax=Nocardioides sp. CFH 31398 TaxID=2919579 RepID=UPI001F06D18E|nr:glycosyltransferase family 4 protein [Nocardioides sp. CFH 31398]MCH1867666.1 glycosyltransferase family 4 protein [Nocardioides sp. CFH 31398]